MLHVTRPIGRKPSGRVLLINPPLEEPHWYGVAPGGEDEVGPTAGTILGWHFTYPLPVGLLRIAGQLLREGKEVYFLDCFSSLPKQYPSSRDRHSPCPVPTVKLTDSWEVRYHHLGLRFEEVDKLLQHVVVDEVLVGCTFTYHSDAAHRVIEIVRKRMPKVKIRFGGIYPTLVPEVARTSQADEVFVGPYPGIEDEALNYEFLGQPPNFILIKGTSGCPQRCAYCAVHKLEGNRFRHRDPEEVFAEIRSKHEQYGLRRVGMWDSNILMQYDEYLGVLLRRLTDTEMPLELTAPEGFDYRLLTPEIARNLKAAGLQVASLALESSDTEYARTRLNRDHDLERLKTAISYLLDAGFEGRCIRLFTMIGLPGQTVESVIRNIRFAWSLGCNATLNVFTPIPGTQLYAESLETLHDLPLQSLHPVFFPCVNDAASKDRLIELMGLGKLDTVHRSQAQSFREVISSPELLAALGA